MISDVDFYRFTKSGSKRKVNATLKQIQLIFLSKLDFADGHISHHVIVRVIKTKDNSSHVIAIMLWPLLSTKADVYQKLQETTWQEFVLAEGMKKFLWQKDKKFNMTRLLIRGLFLSQYWDKRIPLKNKSGLYFIRQRYIKK